MTDLLLFRVGGELFAAELRTVDEAVDLTEMQHVPGASGPTRGIFTLRGVLVPLFSPAPALRVTPGELTMALVVRDGRGRIAIAADDVDDVLTMRDDELLPVPGADGRDGGVLRGLVRRGADLVALVDLEALAAACRAGSHPEAA